MHSLSKEECVNVKPGETYYYKGKHGGHPEATYVARVIQNYKYHVHVYITAVRETINELTFGDPIGYTTCINKVDFGIYDNFYVKEN